MSDYNYSVYSFGQEENQSPVQPQYSPIPPDKPEKKRKTAQMTAGKVIALALCCSLIGGSLGVGGTLLLTRDTAATAAAEGPEPSAAMDDGRSTPVVSVAQVDSGKAITPAENYAMNVSSTVGITTEIVTTNWWGYQTTSPAAGSGFILTEDGYILTNQHVIDQANSIEVTTHDDKTYTASLVGYDKSNDIAVLKIDAEGLTPVVLGDSDELLVGDTVMTIGNPLGELTFSQTVGTVSALERAITFSNGVTMNLIQTDCAINSGNSGGPLFNARGEVVGITNAKSSGSSGGGATIDNIGFAIPINTVRNIFQSIMEKGYVVKPYIGVYPTDVSAEAQSYGLPRGAAISGVIEDSPAEAAGLQANDIVTKVDDRELTCANDLVDAVGKAAPGDRLTLTVYRQGQTIELTIVVGEKKQDLTGDQDSQESQESQSQRRPYGDREDYWGGDMGDLFDYFFNW